MRFKILARILSAVMPNYGTQAHSAETEEDRFYRTFGMSRSEALADAARPRSGQVAPNPVLGWDGLWEKIERLGVLSLPDSSMLPPSANSFLGTPEFYAVEINNGGQYRAYSYTSPASQDWPEAKVLLEIVQVLQDSLWPYNNEVSGWNCKFLEGLPAFTKPLQSNQEFPLICDHHPDS